MQQTQWPKTKGQFPYFYFVSTVTTIAACFLSCKSGELNTAATAMHNVTWNPYIDLDREGGCIRSVWCIIQRNDHLPKESTYSTSNVRPTAKPPPESNRKRWIRYGKRWLRVGRRSRGSRHCPDHCVCTHVMVITSAVALLFTKKTCYCCCPLSHILSAVIQLTEEGFTKKRSNTKKNHLWKSL